VEYHIDERLVHRLEAFSDIVIALSLSEVAFNLSLATRGHDIITHPIFMIGFLGSFTFIASIWWMHSRIFAKYFIPDSVGIVGNFVLLAATVLFAWAQQLLYRSGFDITTVIAYAATGGTVYALIGLLFLRGARDARLRLRPEDKATAVQRGVRALVVGGVLLLSIALEPFGVEAMTYCWLLIAPVVFVVRRFQRAPSSALGTS
jgi:uncharacterized membrane protein